MRYVTRNLNKLKKNIAISDDYQELVMFDRIIRYADIDMKLVTEFIKEPLYAHSYQIRRKFDSDFIASALRNMRNYLENIRTCRDVVKRTKIMTGIKHIELKIMNDLKNLIDQGHWNTYDISRCQPGHQTIHVKAGYSRRFIITVKIPLVPARNAVQPVGEFMSFARALNASELHKNYFILGVSDTYVDINDAAGDIRIGFISYFQTGKNNRSKGIQYTWMCISKGLKTCVVGLGNDPIHAEKRMLRSAATTMRNKIKKED